MPSKSSLRVTPAALVATGDVIEIPRFAMAAVVTRRVAAFDGDVILEWENLPGDAPAIGISAYPAGHLFRRLLHVRRLRLAASTCSRPGCTHEPESHWDRTGSCGWCPCPEFAGEQVAVASLDGAA